MNWKSAFSRRDIGTIVEVPMECTSVLSIQAFLFFSFLVLMRFQNRFEKLSRALFFDPFVHFAQIQAAIARRRCGVSHISAGIVVIRLVVQ